MEDTVSPVKLKRLRGWRGSLAAALAKTAGAPFEWHDNDCGLGLAAPCVMAMTGVDLGEPFRGRYKTAAGALKALKRQGFDDIAATAAHHFEEIHPSRATVGDIAAIKAPDTGWGLGIVIGERIAVLAPSGYATIELTKADRAFKVG